MPPDGTLTENEENYFPLAERFFTGTPVPPDSAHFDSSPHRALADLLLGALIVAVGSEGAQITTTLVAAAAFAILLCAFLDLFGLRLLDAVIVLAIFGLLNQQIMGGEWLFRGYEPKVAAYAFVLAGLVSTIARRRSWVGLVFFAIATYFHFLVGIFWFHAALLWRVIDDRRSLQPAIVTAVSFWVAISPLVGVIAWKRLIIDAAIPAPPGLPLPDYIYAIVRAPWHMAPFVNRHFFAVSWLPGCILAAGMLVGALAMAGTARQPRLRTTARWLVLLLAYLFAALTISYLDRQTGSLGKFYLFRPSSLVLLIWLAAALSWCNELVPRHGAILKLAAVALVLPPYITAAALQIRNEMNSRAELATDKQIIGDFLRGRTAANSVILVDPEIEPVFLDIERTTGRFALVMWKFMPTNDPQILEWYRRMEFRRSVFEQGCGLDPSYRVDYLLTTSARIGFLAGSCGPPALETGRFAVLRTGAVRPP